MKKIVSIVLSILMLLTAFSAVAADINWSELEASGAELIAKGEFVDIESIGMKIWIPTAFPADELTDEDTESGYVAYFISEDQTASIAVMIAELDVDLNGYKDMIGNCGASEMEDVNVNDIPMFTYKLADTDSVCIAFDIGEGCIAEIVMAPASDDGFVSVAAFVAASIMAID